MKTITIKIEGSQRTHKLLATKRTIWPEWDNDWTSDKVALDEDRKQVVYYSKREHKWTRGVACVYYLNDWDPGERCYVEGAPTQRDKKGRRIFYLATILP